MMRMILESQQQTMPSLAAQVSEGRPAFVDRVADMSGKFQHSGLRPPSVPWHNKRCRYRVSISYQSGAFNVCRESCDGAPTTCCRSAASWHPGGTAVGDPQVRRNGSPVREQWHVPGHVIHLHCIRCQVARVADCHSGTWVFEVQALNAERICCSGMGMPPPQPLAAPAPAVDASALLAALQATMHVAPAPPAGPTLEDVLTPDMLLPLLQSSDMFSRLAPHMPEQHRCGRHLPATHVCMYEHKRVYD